MTPSLPSLEKIRDAFDVILSQLFSDGDEPVAMTDSQRELLKRCSRFSADKQEAVLVLIDKM